MTLIARALPVLLLVALVAVLPAAVRAEGSAAQPSLPTLAGFVGPGYDISIRDSGGDLRGREIPGRDISRHHPRLLDHPQLRAQG